VHPLHELLELRVITRAEAQETDLVVPRVPVALQGRLDDCLDRACAERPLDDRGLAEAALPGTPTHDLDRDPIVRGLDEWHDRPGRERDGVKILGNRASHDFPRHIAPRAIHCGYRAVGVVFGFVEARRIRPRRAADDLGDHVLAGLAALLLQGHPLVHDPGKALFAVADYENINERGKDLGILGSWAAGDDQWVAQRALTAVQRDPA